MIDELLATWRATRDPRIEAAIVREGRNIARAKGPIVDAWITRGAKLETAWHAIAAETPQAEIDRLLDVPWSLQWEPMLARVRVLAQFASDPRIARKLVAIARWHLSKPSLALHEAIVPLLVESITPAIAPWLDAVLDCRGPHVWHLYAPVRAALRAIDALPYLDELAHVWDSVYAEPGDLERRAVLGDALADEPRGEFIQLQLTDEKRARGRATRLLAAHLDEWIGPLPLVQRDSVRFARGFPIALISNAGGPILTRTIDRPEWRTIEELSIDGGDCDLAALFHRMPLLRTLELGAVELTTLRGVFPTVRTLVLTGESSFPTREMFPNLRVLAGRWDTADYAQRMAARLELHAIVHRGGGIARIAPLRHVGPAETRISLGNAPLLRTSGWCIRMRRTDRVAELAWHGGGRPNDAGRQVEALVAAGFREIAIHCADPLAASSIAMTYQVRTSGAKITYGREPFSLDEA